MTDTTCQDSALTADISGKPPYGKEGEDCPPRHWMGLLVPYDKAAPDGRAFVGPSGNPKSRNMPLPLTAQVLTAEGHKGSVLIGRVDRVWTQDNALWGEGEFDLESAEGREWASRVDRGMAGWGSVDLDVASMPEVEERGEDKLPLQTYKDWTFAGFTLVARPAFDEARIVCADFVDDEANAQVPDEVAAELADVSLTSAAKVGRVEFVTSADTGLPLGDRFAAWDGVAADGRVRKWAGVDAKEPAQSAWAKYAKAFFWHSAPASGSGFPENFGAYKLPFADVVNGKLTAMPRGIMAAAGALRGARAMVKLPGGDVPKVRAAISSYYSKMKMKTPWDRMESATALMDCRVSIGHHGEAVLDGVVTGFDGDAEWLRVTLSDGGEIIVAADDVRAEGAMAASAASGLIAPPAEWFANPGLTEATALQITEDGRIYGHLAAFGTCHTGFQNSCVTAPRSRTDYSYFHVGEVVASCGTHIAVGKITMNTGHANLSASWRSAAAHYDNTGTAVAIVRCGEDAHGIWVAGSLVPGLEAETVASLRRSPLSGDWRPIGGGLELVAALAVNTPGFPVPRPRAGMQAYKQMSLVAAGVLDPETSEAPDLSALVTSAVEQALDNYSARRQRAAAAVARIASLSAPEKSGCCGGGCGGKTDGPQPVEVQPPDSPQVPVPDLGDGAS